MPLTDIREETARLEGHRDVTPSFTSLLKFHTRLPGVPSILHNHLVDDVPAGNTLQGMTAILSPTSAPIPQLNPIHQAATTPTVK